MSTLQVSNISDGTTTVGTEYVVNGSAKAWYNANTSSTPAFRDSFNLASITDQGTGKHKFNYSNSFLSASQSVCVQSDGLVNVNHTHHYITSLTASTHTHDQLRDENSANRTDCIIASGQVLGDLA